MRLMSRALVKRMVLPRGKRVDGTGRCVRSGLEVAASLAEIKPASGKGRASRLAAPLKHDVAMWSLINGVRMFPIKGEGRFIEARP